MNKDKFFADIYVHLHPKCLAEYRGKVEEELCDLCCVYSVHFDVDEYRNAMFVAYNPEAVSSEVLLETIRGTYAGAARIAYMLMTVSGN
jgi:hypothetical protein